MSDLRPLGFDAVRSRTLPDELVGHWLDGSPGAVAIAGPTLLLVVKPHCDPCHEALFGEWEEPPGVRAVLLAAVRPENGSWDGSPRDVLIAPSAIDSAELVAAPSYTVVGSGRRVRGEGPLFSVELALSEASRLLAD